MIFDASFFTCTLFVDNNECLTNNGDCDMRCINVDGSYSCECFEGFERNDDDVACAGKYLVLANS